MSKKVILVYPKSGVYDEVIKDFPLSLLYVAAIIHNRGYDVTIIDQRVEADWKEKLLYQLSKNPICVGVSVMTGAPIKYALSVSEIVKLNSKVPVVWGGIHPTIMPQQTLEDDLVDIVVRGDGEQSFYELAQALENNSGLDNTKGISYKIKGKIYHNDAREQIDLEECPDLPYELIDSSNYYRRGYEERVISVMTSRGCPHNCAFCYAPTISGRKWRKLSVEQSLRSIELAVEKFDPGYICILDDDFFIDQARAKKILSEIKNKGWKIKFDFRGVRVDDLYRMDTETLSFLAEIGTRNLHIGAESGSQKMLNIMKKGITVEQTIYVNKKLSNFPTLHPTYNFFSGIPTETEDDIFKTTNLVFQLLKENPYCHMTIFNQFTPYPGSELFNMAVEYGYNQPKTLRDWGDFGPDNSANIMPWLNKRLVRLLNTLYVTSYFIDKKLDLHVVSHGFAFRLFRTFLYFYRPIARLRFKKHITFLPLEIIFKDLFFSYLQNKHKDDAQGYFQTRLKFDKNRSLVWRELAKYLGRFIPPQSKIMDLGAGYCDFINNVEAKEKYALDIFYDIGKFANPDVRILRQSATEKIGLASGYLDVVFASNFFEHLTGEDFDKTLLEIKRILRDDGRLIVIQPNYKYFAKRYFDDKTHKQIFTDVSFAEYLERQGFVIEKQLPKFMPATFKSRIPKNAFLVRMYLRLPFKPMAGQFLVVAKKVKEGDTHKKEGLYVEK
ncbi:MAG: radical SAM protein [bacterium]